MSEKMKNNMLYLAAVELLRRMLRDGKYDRKILERLNIRNAETLQSLTVTHLIEFKRSMLAGTVR